ncbi:MAG TPA: FxsA family protein [Alphaproteobacteria bacterium]|nr:FxsA family protein [Alphaproteobacteria bacterium]
MPLLLLVLIVVPIAEIAVFIQVGQWIGLWPTILGILFSAVLGVALLRRQGLRTVRDAQATMRRDELPVRQLFDGLCLFLAGALLLTPGFITDTLGFLLLIPPLRAVIGRWLWDSLRRSGGFVVTTAGAGGAGPRYRPGGDPRVIDAEYREVDGTEPPDDRAASGELPPGGSRWGRRDDR